MINFRLKLILYIILCGLISLEVFIGAFVLGRRGALGVRGVLAVFGVFGELVGWSVKAGRTSVSMILKKFNMDNTSFQECSSLDFRKIIGVCLVGDAHSFDIS